MARPIQAWFPGILEFKRGLSDRRTVMEDSAGAGSTTRSPSSSPGPGDDGGSTNGNSRVGSGCVSDPAGAGSSAGPSRVRSRSPRTRSPSGGSTNGTCALTRRPWEHGLPRINACFCRWLASREQHYSHRIRNRCRKPPVGKSRRGWRHPKPETPKP